jgi:choline-glycine betaine transporter
MIVEAEEDETMIAGTIVGAAEAMGRCISTLKTKVCLVAQMSSPICRAIVVVLILTVRIVNVWCPYARPPLSSQH